MSYTFNKKLVEQVKAGTHCIEFNREKDSPEMLQALCKETFREDAPPTGKLKFYWANCFYSEKWVHSDTLPKDKTPIPLSNFVQPEQSERDVMAELDERLKRLEDILLKDAEISKAEPEIVNPVRWRAEKDKNYFWLDGSLLTNTEREINDEIDNERYRIGNYFQTTQQAEEMAVLMQFTLNNPELVKQLMTKKE